MSPRALVVAHRGMVPGHVENSVPGFIASAEQGADAVEFDVRLTSDGVPIVMHDETVDRTTDGHGDVRELTSAHIRSLNAGSEDRPRVVPSLDEVLAIPNLDFELEIRDADPAHARVIFQHVAGAGALNRTTFTSSHREQLSELRRLDGTVAIGVFAGACATHIHTHPGCGLMAWCREHEPTRVHISSAVLDEARAGFLRSQGFEIQSANANAEAEMRRAVSLADRVSTDHLAELLRCRQHRSSVHPT